MIHLLHNALFYLHSNAILAIIAMSFGAIITMHYFNIAQPYTKDII